MSTLNGQWLEIFRAGDYGAKGNYTAQDLNQLAASYDPAKHEAPICVGHPTHDAPAFGWIKGLKVQGDTLLALPGEVAPALDAAVAANHYKKRSVALTRQPDGTLQLRHLGFLGAMPPEVKGLRDARFSEEKFEEVEFSEGEEMDNDQLKRTISEFFAEMFGKKEAAPLITQADLDRARTDAVAQATAAAQSTFAAQLQTERDARTALETRFSDSAAVDQAQAAITSLKFRKRWLPAYDRMGVPQIFAHLASQQVDVTFADGKKKSSVQTFADFLDSLGQIVPEGTIVTASGKLEVPAAAPNANGADIHAGSVAFTQAIKARATEKQISFGEAMGELRAEGQSSDTFGGATAGAV